VQVVTTADGSGAIAEFCRENGYIAYADAGAGVWAFVCKMLWNHRVVLGTTEAVLDAWCYEDLPSALNALQAWDPACTSEPEGWKKHPSSGRYREGGDPRLETLNGQLTNEATAK